MRVCDVGSVLQPDVSLDSRFTTGLDLISRLIFTVAGLGWEGVCVFQEIGNSISEVETRCWVLKCLSSFKMS